MGHLRTSDRCNPHFTRFLVSVGFAFACAVLLITGVRSSTSAAPAFQADPCSGISEIPLTECEALYQLYVSTDGATSWRYEIVDSWPHDGSAAWFSNAEPCTWFGIKCTSPAGDGERHVTAIHLSRQRQSAERATLPGEWLRPSMSSPFTLLNHIQLEGNNLSGPVPDWFWQPPITELWIADNWFTGEIPSDVLLANPTMAVLWLHGNNWSGAIPNLCPKISTGAGDLVDTCTKLKSLSLGNRNGSSAEKMDASVVAEMIGNIPSLTQVSIIHTNLAEIPTALYDGRLPGIRGINLSENEITGALPAELFEIESLTNLTIQSNHLKNLSEAAIPEPTKPLPNLIRLRLGNNQLSGALPDFLAEKMPNLVTLALSNNNFTGTIPESWEDMSDLKEIYLRGNNLIPPISDGIAAKWNAIDDLQFDIADNHFDYNHPSSPVLSDDVKKLLVKDTTAISTPIGLTLANKGLYQFEFVNGGAAISDLGSVQVCRPDGTCAAYDHNNISDRHSLVEGDQLVFKIPIYSLGRSIPLGITDPEQNEIPENSFRIQLANVAEPVELTSFGLQVVPVRPLVLLDLLVSVSSNMNTGGETARYLDDLRRAFEKASQALYHATEGQFAIGELVIQDNGRNWSIADIQILESNDVRPNAQILGIKRTDATIMLGAGWPGNTSWSASNPDGYWTIVHELLHYIAPIYDSFIDQKDSGDRDNDGNTDEIVSIPLCKTLMASQYEFGTLAFEGEHNLETCKDTEQWEKNEEYDWQTLVEEFESYDPRLQFSLPIVEQADRPEPTDLPDLAPHVSPALSVVAPELGQPTVSETPLRFRVTIENSPPDTPVEVYLRRYHGDPAAQRLGFYGIVKQCKDEGGNPTNDWCIDIPHLEDGDRILFLSGDGSWIFEYEYEPTNAPSEDSLIDIGLTESKWKPLLRAELQEDEMSMDLSLHLQSGAGAPTELKVYIQEPGGKGFRFDTMLVKSDDITGGPTYTGNISLSVERSAPTETCNSDRPSDPGRDCRTVKNGYILVEGDLNGQTVMTLSNFRVEGAPGADQGEHTGISMDGNFEVSIDSESLRNRLLLVTPVRLEPFDAVQAKGRVPTLPAGAKLVGTMYDLSVSGGDGSAAVSAAESSVDSMLAGDLKIFFDEASLAGINLSVLQVYHWDEISGKWQSIPSTTVQATPIDGGAYGSYVRAKIEKPGIYGIMAAHRAWLPMVVNR